MPIWFEPWMILAPTSILGVYFLYIINQEKIGKHFKKNIKNFLLLFKDHRPPSNMKAIIFENIRGFCPGCKARFPLSVFRLDHIIPISEGGEDIETNLQILCSKCKREKDEN